MSTVHASAVVHPSARISEGVIIGPFCLVGEHVKLEKNVRLHSHVVLEGRTHIDEGTEIYPFASIGHPPQDLKFKGEPSSIEVGKDCKIREHVTINPGTEGGGMVTRIGDYCLLMVGVHIAHDCKLGNHIIMANNATLAGHVSVGDHTIIGGLAAVHQFVRIGKQAIIGGMAGVESDVIPYGSVVGERGHLAGLNLVGLKRRGFDRDTIHALRNAFKDLFESDVTTLSERALQVEQKYANIEAVTDIIAFMRSETSRSLLTPRAGHE